MAIKLFRLDDKISINLETISELHEGQKEDGTKYAAVWLPTGRQYSFEGERAKELLRELGKIH